MSDSKCPPVKRRKVLRDEIQGLRKPAFQRLMRRAGIKRNSALVYEQLRGVAKANMEEILKQAVLNAESARRKTVTVEDIVRAIKIVDGVDVVVPLDAEKHVTMGKCAA